MSGRRQVGSPITHSIKWLCKETKLFSRTTAWTPKAKPLSRRLCNYTLLHTADHHKDGIVFGPEKPQLTWLYHYVPKLFLEEEKASHLEQTHCRLGRRQGFVSQSIQVSGFMERVHESYLWFHTSIFSMIQISDIGWKQLNIGSGGSSSEFGILQV